MQDTFIKAIHASADCRSSRDWRLTELRLVVDRQPRATTRAISFRAFDSANYADRPAWQRAVDASEVRLQWDPDYSPSGSNLDRRAIQLGLRGSTLERYVKEWLVSIDDPSDFVATQRRNVHTHGWAELVTPREEPYPVTNPDVIRKLRLDW